MRLPIPPRAIPKSLRTFHASSPTRLPRKSYKPYPYGIPPPVQLQKTGLLLDEDEDLDIEDTNEGTSAGHLILRQQRERLYHMRLIDHDMPHLVRWRKAFVPPSTETPLIVRTISYGGEEHPATAKRSVVAPVAQLPLMSPSAIHNIKLLAGSRWTPSPPRNSGVFEVEEGSDHGYIHISCEDFPQPGMNLKWASDVLDRLITESNAAGDQFAKLPLDTRHVEARARKVKKGMHYYSPVGTRPTLKDFPKDWLPRAPLQSHSGNQEPVPSSQ